MHTYVHAHSYINKLTKMASEYAYWQIEVVLHTIQGNYKMKRGTVRAQNIRVTTIIPRLAAHIVRVDISWCMCLIHTSAFSFSSRVLSTTSPAQRQEDNSTRLS